VRDAGLEGANLTGAILEGADFMAPASPAAAGVLNVNTC
jgi:hypothetical protein